MRNLKVVFGMGTDKLSCLMKDGIKYGYLVKKGNYLIALPVYVEKGYNFKLKFERKSCSIVGEKSFYKLKRIVKELRCAFLANHVKTLNEVCDTKNKVMHGYPGFKRNKKRVKGMRNIEKVKNTLSLETISTILSIYRDEARSLIKILVEKKVLKKKRNFINKGRISKEFISGLKSYCATVYGKNFFETRGNVFQRIADTFIYESNVIFYKSPNV